MKMVCPGRVTALAVTPDGNYCVAAVAEKIHIWQVGVTCIACGLCHLLLKHHFF